MPNTERVTAAKKQRITWNLELSRGCEPPKRAKVARIQNECHCKRVRSAEQVRITARKIKDH